MEALTLNNILDFTIRTDLTGKKSFQFAYNQCHIGPKISRGLILIGPFEVKNEDEVQAIITLKDDMIEEHEYKEDQGSRRVVWVPKVAVTRAESILSKETVKQIKQAFTQRALKKIAKRRNYTKRSQTIKVDPITKELVLPNGDRVKQNQKDENANTIKEVQSQKNMWKVKAPIEDEEDVNLTCSDEENPLEQHFFEKYFPGQKRKLPLKEKKSKWYKE